MKMWMLTTPKGTSVLSPCGELLYRIAHALGMNVRDVHEVRVLW